MYILSLLEIGQYIPQSTPTMTCEQGNSIFEKWQDNNKLPLAPTTTTTTTAFTNVGQNSSNFSIKYFGFDEEENQAPE